MAHYYLAQKTLAAIDAAIEADQGASYRGWLGKVIPHMGDAFRDKQEDGFRSHMGASMIGRPCGRAIWYSFRWATKPRFTGRILRLFNRGHLEEARFIACLLSIGVQVYQQDANGKQYRISDSFGHFGGSGDGIAVGIPDLPAGLPALLEFKTHNDASFKKLVKEGVKEAKPDHYIQMQAYCRKMGLTAALYGAVNKNDDTLHMELIELNAPVADEFVGRAHKLIFMRQAPTKINNSPGWFECKWCDHRDVCHLNAKPAENCRTCRWSEPVESADNSGKWVCNNPVVAFKGEPVAITTEEQLKGCSHYEQGL